MKDLILRDRYGRFLKGHRSKGRPFQKGHESHNKLPKGEAACNMAYTDMKRRAKKSEREWKISKEEFRDLSQMPCYYCGEELSNEIGRAYSKQMNGVYRYNGLDRIDNKEGYTADNVVSCCKVCNRLKNNLSLIDFYARIEKIYLRRVKNVKRVEQHKSLTAR